MRRPQWAGDKDNVRLETLFSMPILDTACATVADVHDGLAFLSPKALAGVTRPLCSSRDFERVTGGFSTLIRPDLCKIDRFLMRATPYS